MYKYRLIIAGNQPIGVTSDSPELTVREIFRLAGRDTNGYTFNSEGRDIQLDSIVQAGGRIAASTKLAGGRN